MRGVHEYLAMNRGRVSRRALGRLDVKRIAMAAEEMTNCIPTNLGPMQFRPGLQYITATDGNAATRQIPFIFASDDSAMVDVTTSSIRVRIDDAVISRPTVTAAISNGAFGSNLTGWSDEDEGATAASAWVTGGYMGLTGDGTQYARRRQTLAIIEQNVEHALRIVINRGPVTLRVGSASGGDEYINETILEVGEHSLAFTPTGANAYIELGNREKRQALVESIAVESAGVMELPSPWSTLASLRHEQSGDVLFVADGSIQQRRIERRDARSWSVVKYLSTNGPFRLTNTSPTTIAASGVAGNVTLTASKSLFRSTHVGSVWSITSVGQTVSDAFSSDNVFTDPIRVSGIEEARRFYIYVTGTFVATLTIQYSFDEGATWTDQATTISVPTSTNLQDGLDNQIVFFRIGIKTGDYTSGTANASLVYQSGSITGVVRLTAYTSTTSVDAEVLQDLGGTSATATWSEGEWSDKRGWPSSVVLHDGRLWWSGKDRFWGSVTDQFDNFDPDFEGDAGPIQRSIGSGPVDTISWLVSCGRLLAGADASIIIPRSSSFDEPLTPSNFTPKTNATRGAARVAAIKVDDSAIYVHANGRRVIEMAMDPTRVDYAPTDLTELCPEFGEPGIIRLAVQREPDTRIHCVRSDGTVGVIVFNKLENVLALCDIETDGEVEDVAVLPGDSEDSVYYVVKRAVNGSDVRYIEKVALESEARGAAVTKMADSFVYASGAASSISGLSHLEGESVVLWGNGKDLGTATVSSGSVTLPESATNRCAGLAYRGRFRSAKLAYVVPNGLSALGQPKHVNELVLVACDTHHQGVEFGTTFDTLDPMPASEEFTTVAEDTIHEDYEGDVLPLNGSWETDTRLCLEFNAPRPATIMGVVINMDTIA